MNRILLILLVNLWKITILLPRSIHLKFGSLLGHLFYFSSMKRNKFSKKNIDLCFPQMNSKEKEHLHKLNIISSGKIPFDTGVAWFWSDKRIKKSIQYEIKGLEKLIFEQNSENGVLLFFKHSLHLELDARLLSMNAEIYGVERSHNSNLFDSIQGSGRLKSMKDICDRDSPIKFMRWLKKGKTVLYATDQDYGLMQSEIVDFFDHPSATISAPLKIVNRAKCKTYFLNSYVKNNKYILEIENIKLDDSASFKFSKDLNKYMERKIRDFPEEYLWQHRRFKSTLGKENFYEQ